MELAEIKVNDWGGAPAADHNMPCAVCRENHAVLNLNTGRFHPCWCCQDMRRVDLVQWKRWVPKWLKSIVQEDE